MRTADFLNVIWPSQGFFCVAQRKVRGDRSWWQHSSYATQAEAVQKLLDVGQLSDVYFTVLSLREAFIIDQNKIDKAVKDGRTITDYTGRVYRSHANIGWARTYFMDIDVGKAGGYPMQKAAFEALKQFVKRAGLPKPWIVSSGVGLHVYWPLAEDVPAETWHIFALKLKALCAHFELQADGVRTADMASVLRPPGTFHHKDPNNPKRVQVAMAGDVTSFEDWCKRVDRAYQLTPTGELHQGERPTPMAATSVDLSQLRKACALADSMIASPEEQSEPRWYKLLGLVKFTEGGATAAHEVSSGHPGYTAEETDAKLVQLDRRMPDGSVLGPTTCRIMADTCGPEHCRTCWFSKTSFYKDGSSSPIVAARQLSRVHAVDLDSSGDVKNGRLFARMFRDKLLHVHELDVWLVFDPKSGWLFAPPGEADRAAKSVLTSMRNEAAERYKIAPDEGRRLMEHVSRTSLAPRLRAMIDMAESEPGMTIQLCEFDADPMLLGVANGVLDLRTGKLVPVSPEVLVSKRCNVLYRLDADCPRFDGFLSEVQPDPLIRAFLQRWVGYCLTGRADQQAFIFLHGHGSNGKSVLIELIAWLLGDYARKISTAMLMQHQRNPQGPSPDIVDLKGRRFVFANETEEGRRLAEALIKDLTGGDTLSGRVPYGKAAITFRPTHKLAIAGNHKPDINDASHGMWRRVILIPFDRTIPEHARDSRLPEKLRDEGSGILNWALEGLRMLRADGLQVPARIKAATAAYRDEQDIMGEWIAERCTMGATYIEAKTALYADYTLWCELNGHRPLAQGRLTRRLNDRGHQLDAGRRNVSGLMLKRSSSLSTRSS